MMFANEKKDLGCPQQPFHKSKFARIHWLLARLWLVFSNEGALACIRKSCAKLGGIALGHSSGFPLSYPERVEQYQVWRKDHGLSPDSIKQMRNCAEQMVAPQRITVILPVKSIDEEGLRETVESFRAQTYPYWKLVVMGDISCPRSLKHMVEAYSREDPRIQLKIMAEMERPSDCVLEQVSGEFVGFLSENCCLSLDAIFVVARQLEERTDLDFLYTDEDTIRASGEFVDPFFKPGWSPDLLIAMNYVGHFNVVRKNILLNIGEDWGEIGDDGQYHLVLRVTEETSKIARIPKILCHCRGARGSTSAVSDHVRLRIQAEMKSLRAALDRRGERAEVLCDETGRVRVAYHVTGVPLVSIIIPTRDRWDMLRQCIESIEALTGYPSYEIVVIDNESRVSKAKEYLQGLSGKWSVYRFSDPFNFSQINNFGASKARGEFFLFLNDDTQVISRDWLNAMVAQAQRVGVGAVGAKLLYPSGRIQHAGVVLGVRGVAAHAFRHLPGDQEQYHGLSSVMRNCSAVTAACMLVSAKTFSQVGGFEPRLRVEYNDVDLCLRLIREGYRIVYTPDALLVHHENASRKGGRHPEDEAYFLSRWGERICQGDPYYNPNLTSNREDWSIQV